MQAIGQIGVDKMGVPYKYLEKETERYKDDVVNARITVDGVVHDGMIKSIKQEGQTLKIFVLLDDYKGKITKIEIYNGDDEIMYERDVDVDKLPDTGYVATIQLERRSVQL